MKLHFLWTFSTLWPWSVAKIEWVILDNLARQWTFLTVDTTTTLLGRIKTQLGVPFTPMFCDRVVEIH